MELLSELGKGDEALEEAGESLVVDLADPRGQEIASAADAQGGEATEEAPTEAATEVEGTQGASDPQE